jgi:phage terminase large subunit-like protein
MPRALRGERYRTQKNASLDAFIINELPYLDYDDTLVWYEMVASDLDREGRALLGCNDRYYLFIALLGRTDGLHPWLFDRCREVEAESDGYIDLWARGHFKSSLISFAGIIQEIVCDPEITVAIFSVTKPIAQTFLGQIKDEFENNEYLKYVYSDVFYANPRTKGQDGRPAKWGLARGITVKRKGKPKEATIEAHGLIDGQPTGRHFHLHDYDDIVTQDHLSDDLIRKTTERWEMADNLGTHLGVRKWMPGTRYHYADTYSVVLDKKRLKARIYPATENGQLNGKPVLLSEARWAQIKRDQGPRICAAQMLLNPVAGTEATFQSSWLRTYDVIPAVMNVYILCDPSRGAGVRSDRTAIAVIGIDTSGNKYLLDGARHRMRLSERYELIKQLKRKWERHHGVQLVRIGYERYGQQVDLEVIEDIQRRENDYFELVELNTPHQGGHSKNDRITRLEPDIREGRFYLPCVAYHADFAERDGLYAGLCYWAVYTNEMAKRADAEGIKTEHRPGAIVYRPMRGLTRAQRATAAARVVTALKRRDENGEIYDVTRGFIDEMIRHPFAPHDDMIDACSRIYDIDPLAPVSSEGRTTLSLEAEADHDIGISAASEDSEEPYDVASDPNATAAGSLGKRF